MDISKDEIPIWKDELKYFFKNHAITSEISKDGLVLYRASYTNWVYSVDLI